VKQLKGKFRLRFVLPLAIVAIVGLAVFQLGLVDRLTGDDETASAAPPAASEPAPPAEPATTPSEDGTTDGTEGGTENEKPAEKPTGAEQLDKKLAKHKIVVMIVYSPEGAVDSSAISEARLGADDANAGFLAINGNKEHEVGDLANEYDVRSTPTVLIFERGPSLANKAVGWVDRQTVAQLVEDARHS
jgi:hypothetical protein